MQINTPPSMEINIAGNKPIAVRGHKFAPIPLAGTNAIKTTCPIKIPKAPEKKCFGEGTEKIMPVIKSLETGNHLLQPPPLYR